MKCRSASPVVGRDDHLQVLDQGLQLLVYPESDTADEPVDFLKGVPLGLVQWLPLLDDVSILADDEQPEVGATPPQRWGTVFPHHPDVRPPRHPRPAPPPFRGPLP